MEYKIGDRIEIDIPDGEYKGKYHSVIFNIEPEYMEIVAPVVRGVLIPVRPGTHVHVFYTRQDALYKFEGEILERKEQNNVSLLILPIPKQITRIQRRSFVRVEVTIPFILIKKEDGIKWKAYSVDLSAGGVRVRSDRDLAVGSIVDVEFYLPTGALIRSAATVVRKQLVPGQESGKENQYYLSMAFNDLDNSSQQKILHYVFRCQQETRWKGLDVADEKSNHLKI